MTTHLGNDDDTGRRDCVRCGRPVVVNVDRYEVFERMHYVCFHYEFEHGSTDTDDECRAGGCPSGAVTGGRDDVVRIARDLATAATRGDGWENDTVAAYLAAFSAWLNDCDGYYGRNNRVTPSNAWTVVSDALRAATVYE